MDNFVFVPIIKPVGGSCNMSCSYCYFHKKEGGRDCGEIIMTNDILKSLIDQVCSIQKESEFIWHGGEPLLAGLDFFKKVVEVESYWVEKGKQVRNSIQSNCTLVNNEWVEFFSKNNFSIGTSIDGPLHLHDLSRIYAGGAGTFKSTLRGLKQCQEAGILNDVICCVSEFNVDFPGEIFDYFVSEEIFKMKFLQVQGRNNKGELLPGSVSGEKYAKFLLSILDKWITLDDERIEIREIKSIINMMMGGDFRECIFSGECYKYFTVYPDGSIYGCDSLPKVEALRFGSVQQGVSLIRSSQNFQNFCYRAVYVTEKCRSCEWFNLCRGGCLQDWFPDIYKDDTQNMFCGAMKEIFSEIKNLLHRYDMIK